MFRRDSLISLRMARALSFCCFSLVLLTACGGGQRGNNIGADSSTSNAAPVGGVGTLQLSMTADPACGYSSVNLSIQKIRVHQSSTASDTDEGWSEIAFDPAKRVDLQALNNGVLAGLGQIQIPAGHYAQLGLVLARNDGTTLLANSVVPAGGAEVALTVPSKGTLNFDFDVTANAVTDLVLDVDACRSVTGTDTPDQYLLAPLVKVVPHYLSGVAGYLDPSLATGLTKVSVQQSGVVVKAATPDSTGHFLLQPLAPGRYDLVITDPNHATTVITGVPVVADTVTPINTSLTALQAPGSNTGWIAGIAQSTQPYAMANLQVQQTLSGGRTIEIAGSAASGHFRFYLAADAPRVAAYVVPPDKLEFAADSSDAVAASILVKATANGVTHTFGPTYIMFDGSSSSGGVTIAGNLAIFLF